MKLPKRFRGGRVEKVGGRLSVCRWRENSSRYTMLPSARGAETHNQLPERRISMVQMGFGERNQLTRQVALHAAGAIAISFEMTLLGGEKIGRDRPAAGIVKFLRVRFWVAFHGVDVAEVGVGAVGPVHPKTGRRVSLSDIPPPEEVFDTGSDLCWAIGDDRVIPLEQGNLIIVVRSTFHDLVVGMAGKHLLEMG
jgi:hypothetical protein